jgi:hypothetical protein
MAFEHRLPPRSAALRRYRVRLALAGALVLGALLVSAWSFDLGACLDRAAVTWGKYLP